jgi:S-layer protein (TIGR01567 family)
VADGTDLRGEMATVGSDFTWTHQNFPGFYYDLDEDLGIETLQIDSADSSADIRYSSTVQNSDFQFQDWGYYRVLGFMGQRCFAGYISSEDSWFNTLFEESDDKDLLSGGYISKILLDDDSQRVVATGEPLKLEQGYELLIKKISDRDRKISLDLLKDGQSVDSSVLSPSQDGATMSDKTYCYKKDLGEAKGMVTLAIHFKNAYNDTEAAVVTIDGLWQISDEPISLKAGEKLGLMNVVDASESGISLASEDLLTIIKGQDLQIMGNLCLRAADQETVDPQEPLRYYPYIKAADRQAEVKSSVAATDYTWNAQSFAGFYYDLDDNIGTESLSAKVTEGNVLSGDFPYGITYQTAAQRKAFSFQDWGYYNAIGFLTKCRFAGYSDDEDYGKASLYQRSRDENSLACQQILDILMDENREQVLSKGDKLELKGGYELRLVGGRLLWKDLCGASPGRRDG